MVANHDEVQSDNGCYSRPGTLYSDPDAEAWWDSYRSECPASWWSEANPSKEQRSEFAVGMWAKHRVQHLAALDRIAAKIEGMTVAETNRHDVL